jgi:hypothetical protein
MLRTGGSIAITEPRNRLSSGAPSPRHSVQSVTALAERSEPFYPAVTAMLFIAGLGLSSFVNVRLTSFITLGDGLLIAALVLMGYRFLASPQSIAINLIRPAFYYFCVLSLVVGGTLSSLLASDRTGSFGGLVRILFVTVALPLLASSTLTREIGLVWAMYVVAVAGAIQGVGAALQLQGIDVPFLGPLAYGRLSGFSDHVNHLGSAGALAAPIALAAALLTARKPLISLLLALCSLLCLAAVLLSGSVGAALGTIVGAGVMGYYWLKFRPGGLPTAGAMVSGIFVIACLLIAFSTVGPMLRERLDTGVTPMDRLTEVRGGAGTGSIRLATIRAALDRIYKNPLVGVGFAEKDSVAHSGQQVHNAPLMIWHTGGVLAMFGYLGVILIAVKTVRRDSGQKRLRIVQAGILGSLAAAFTVSLTQPVLFQRFPWVPVLLAFSSVFARSHQSAGYPKPRQTAG